MDSTVEFLGHVPFLLPLTAVAMVVGTVCVVSLAVFAVLCLVYSDFRVAVGSSQTGLVLYVYTPALTQTAAEGVELLRSGKDVFFSLGSFLQSDAFRVLLSLVMAAAVGLPILFYHHQMADAAMTAYTSPLVSGLRRFLLEMANLASFIVGTFISAYNAFVSLEWIRMGVIERVSKNCAIDTATNSLESFLLKIGDIITSLFVDAIFGFIDSPNLLYARFNLVPLFGHVGDLSQIVTAFLDCGCGYLQFVYKEPLEWLQYPQLHIGLDHAANAPVRLIQGIFIGALNLKFPQLEETVLELIPAIYALMRAAFQLGVVVLNVAKNIINLIPFTSAADGAGPRVSLGAVVGAVSTKQLGAVQSYTVAAEPLSLNASAFLGIDLLINILASPLPDAVSGVAAGALAFVNGTWSLTLLVTDAQLAFSDIAYFQVGHIFDHFRNGFDALGEGIGVIHPDLGPGVSGLGTVSVTAVQIAFELIIGTIFYNAYQLPAVDGDPFKFALDYCASNESAAALNHENFFNHSAAIARLFGCDPFEGIYPLESPAATCESSSALGCVFMSTYRLAVELQKLLATTACYASELVRFESDPTMKTFADIPLDAVYRQLTHLAACIRALIILFDIPALGTPAGEACTYTLSGGGTGYKISFPCYLGDFVQSAIMVFVPASYEILKLMQMLLASFARFSYTAEIGLPTLENSLRNLEVAMCRLGGLLATFLPVTFSCSAQASTADHSPTTVRAPLKPWGRAVNLPWTPTQINGETTCAFTPQEWVGDLNATCDCNDTALYGATDYAEVLMNASSPACALECMLPQLFEFPLRIGTGADVYTGYTPYPYYMGVNFTTPTALRRFLQTTHNPLHAMTGIPYVSSVQKIASDGNRTHDPSLTRRMH